MIQVKPPHSYHNSTDTFTIFLGGSIEMDRAEHWQERIAEDLADEEVLLLNPRRDNWDSSWAQDPTPGTPFHEQVIWELTAQDHADLLVYYFDPATVSAITLLELGAYGGADPEAVAVCCPPTYFRYGNVKIFCDRCGITLFHSYDELIRHIKDIIYHANF
jgi:hypothetical protein